MEFNASLIVTELLAKTLENAAKEFAIQCITEVARRHNFDVEKEIELLNLANVSLIRKKMAKKTAEPKKQKEPKEKKSAFPLPFDPALVNVLDCQALVHNHGLFTQCQNTKMVDGDFCKGCQSKADKSASGKPDCGTVADRIATDLFGYKDFKGRKQVPYVKVLRKLSITDEDVIKHTGMLQISINPKHFVDFAEEKKKEKKAQKKEQKKEQNETTEKKGRGRPKKTPPVIRADDVDDLYNQLGEIEIDVSDDEVEEEVEPEVIQPVAEVVQPVAEVVQKKEKAKAKLSETEKEAKVIALEQEREANKKAKEAEKEAIKKAKEAEKEAAKKAKEDAKKTKKATPDAKKTKDENVAKNATPEQQATEVNLKVKRFEIDGVKYLISVGTNVLYDLQQNEVGIWNEETKTIDPLPEEDDEEIEEDADEDEEEVEDEYDA